MLGHDWKHYHKILAITGTCVQISMAEVGQAWQNGYAERLIRTIKEEEVDGPPIFSASVTIDRNLKM